MRTKLLLLLAASTSVLLPLAATAGEFVPPKPLPPMEQSQIGAPTEEYDKVLENSRPVAGGLALEAEAALGSGRYDRAIQLARRSLKRDINDIDTHRCLAESLEMKYEKDPAHDQLVLRECLLEYLAVMKSEYGEEKGVSAVGPGFFAKLYGDDDTDRYAWAKARIKALTGSLPRPWETNTKFLARVVKPEVHAKLLNQTVH